MATKSKQNKSAKTKKAVSKKTVTKTVKKVDKPIKAKANEADKKSSGNNLVSNIKLKFGAIKWGSVRHWLKFSLKWTLIVAIIFFFVGGPVIAAWMNDQSTKEAKRKQEEVQKQIEEYQKQVQEQQSQPKEVDESLKVDGDITQLQIIDEKTGDGAEAKAGDIVKVRYKGALATTGEVFDSNDTGLDISLNQVIEGWKEGIPGMKVGGVRILKIPSDKAYGEQGNSSIPANSDLVFRVELLEVNPSQ